MNITFCGCSFAVTRTGPGGFMVYVVLCTGAPEGSTRSGSVLKYLRRRGHGLKSHLTEILIQLLITKFYAKRAFQRFHIFVFLVFFPFRNY